MTVADQLIDEDKTGKMLRIILDNFSISASLQGEISFIDT